MRIKKIKIKSSADFFRDLKTIAKALDQEKTPKKQTGEYFESLEAVRNMLTEKRLELWRIIRDQKPKSISALAKIVDREFKAVHRDLNLLQSVGLIKLKKSKGDRGDLQSPVALFDELQLSVA